MCNIFYKSLSERKSQAEIKYVSLKSSPEEEDFLPITNNEETS